MRHAANILTRMPTIAQPLLLDIFPSAAFWFELRQVRLAFTSTVLDVRRSSDDDQLSVTIPQLLNGELTDFTGGGDGFIVNYYGQSLSAEVLNQGMGPLQPQIVDSGSVIMENGRPTIRNVPGGYMTATGISVSQPDQMFVVATHTDSAQEAFFDGITTRQLLYDHSSGDATMFTGGEIQSGVDTQQQRLYSCLFNGANSTLRIDGVEEAAGNLGTTVLGGLTVFAFSSLSGNLTGNMQVLGCFPSDFSANQETVEADINGHYTIY